MKRSLVSTSLLATTAIGIVVYGSFAPPAPSTLSPITLAFAQKDSARPLRLDAAATAFLASLRPEQRQKAVFPFENEDERLNWHFIPKPRKGLTFLDMDADQQKAALALLRSGLGATGFRKLSQIRELEKVLRLQENDTAGTNRNPDRYYFSVFGTPGDKGVWGWRYEGHHISLNWTIIDGTVIASSPQFFGANPARVASGPLEGTRVLAAEEDLGRALVTSLDETQRKVAILDPKAPSDIVSGATREAAILEDRGIAYRDLKRPQQDALLALIREYAAAQPDDLAKRRLDAIRKAGLDSIRFAWMGGIEPGQGHYYRVQGKTFLIEFDDTQTNANHIHSVWRDFKGDFGRDLLAEHYARFPHTPK